MEADLPFTRWLKQRRKALDLSQEALAEAVGCAAETISKLERGARRPSREVAERLAQVLQLAPDERSLFVRAARATPQPHVRRAVEPPRETSTATGRPATRRPALPSFPTPIFGRQAELAELARLLATPTCRLVTLLGPGGMGKTRLAVECGALARQFAHGVAFVALAAVESPALLAATIADAVGFSFYGSGEPRTQLLDYLREKELLLILDNLEHLVDDVRLVLDLLAHAPLLKVLVTSRERLQLQGEWVVELGGLPVTEGDSHRRTAASDAVALFVERAQRVQHGFRMRADDRVWVTRICRLLDGMPLGIELAATWVRVLRCSDICAELERNLDFLAAPVRDLPQRHRSLRAVFEHSWRLLSQHEQQVLTSLTVFRGGFSRAAAEEIAGASLPTLAALVDKSLLRRSADATASQRYDLHDLVRQFAAATLQHDAPREFALRATHGRYYAQLLARSEALLKSADQQAAVAQLNAEIDNLRYAWEWAVAQRSLPAIRQMLIALGWFYEVQARFPEAEEAFGYAVRVLIEHAESPDPQSNRPSTIDTAADTTGAGVDGTIGHLLGVHGWFCFRMGRTEQAHELLQRSQLLLQQADDQAALAYTLLWLGYVTHLTGDPPAAHGLLAGSLALARAIDDRWLCAVVLAILGQVVQALGDYGAAEQRLSESLRLWEAVGDPRGTVFALNALSALAQAQGAPGTAHAALQRSLVVTSSVDDPWGMASLLNQLGRLGHAQGEYAEALYFFHESCALFREIGDRWGLAQALTDLGHVTAALGDLPAARHTFVQAFTTATEAQTIPIGLEALVGLATVLVSEGRPRMALDVCLHVLDHPSSTAQIRERVTHLHGDLSAHLPAEQRAGAAARARTRSLAAVVEELRILG